MLMCFCQTVEAQIQRNFWGLELGRSTKADVKAFLASEGFEYEENFFGHNAIAPTDIREFSFGGYSWSPTFGFYKNTLFLIQMVRAPLGFSSTMGKTYEIDTKSIFDKLRRKLNNKYGDLEVVKTSLSEPNFVVRDYNTVVQLILGTDNTILLQYADRRLARMDQNGDDL